LDEDAEELMQALIKLFLTLAVSYVACMFLCVMLYANAMQRAADDAARKNAQVYRAMSTGDFAGARTLAAEASDADDLSRSYQRQVFFYLSILGVPIAQGCL